MSDPRKGVVFRIVHDEPTTRPILSRERSLYSVRAGSNFKSQLLQEGNKVVVSLVLFVGKLRFTVNLVARRVNVISLN